MAQFLKRFLFILVLLAGSFRMGAQDPGYFIYLQSERSQPFYVRYDGKLLSSSDKGYLIISKLHAGTASLRIGFANNSFPEQQFLVRLSGSNDQGYLIKKDGENGFALYNLQTFASIKPNTNKEAHKEAVAAVAAKDTAVVAVAENADAKMNSLQKDLDSAFATNTDVKVGPGSRPVGPIAAPPVAAAVAPAAVQSNKFSQALDKVVGDDRVEEVVPVDDPPVVDTVAAETTVAEAPVKKGRKKRREREGLTVEEQQLAADVIAEERLSAAGDTTAVAAEVPAPVEKKNKKRKKAESDPAFINFMDDSTKQVAAAAPAEVAAVPVTATEEPSSRKKKRRKADKVEDVNMEVSAPVAAEAVAVPVTVTEEPSSKKKKRKTEDNIVVDSTNGYALSDLSIDHPKESKKDRKKKRDAEAAAAAAAVPVAAAEPVVVEEKPSTLKMINSDCGNVLDEANFRKVLRKFVAGKDDDGMIDAFRRNTKGYCIETSQIKTLVQLLGTNESRYRLLDLAYPKISDTSNYGSLETVLTDDYYKGRFKAMLHK